MLVSLLLTQEVIGQLLISNGFDKRVVIKNGFSLKEEVVKEEFRQKAQRTPCIWPSSLKVAPKSLLNDGTFLPQLVRTSIVNELGIFCKNELALHKITPISIRFRLGSLDYVNWMEQKPNAIKPGR